MIRREYWSRDQEVGNYSWECQGGKHLRKENSLEARVDLMLYKKRKRVIEAGSRCFVDFESTLAIAQRLTRLSRGGRRPEL